MGRGGDARRRHHQTEFAHFTGEAPRKGNRELTKSFRSDGFAGGHGRWHSISIRAELDPRLPRTTGGPRTAAAGFDELMLNGIEAMRETGGELTIASKRIEHSQL